MTTIDPTTPLTERTPEQIAAFLDDHLITALTAADLIAIGGDRQAAEDLVRDRLVAISDSWPDPHALADEDSRRRMNRLGWALRGPTRTEPTHAP